MISEYIDEYFVIEGKILKEASKAIGKTFWDYAFFI